MKVNEDRMWELEGRVGDLEEVLEEPAELRESWLERNVAAEGEVAILRERVDEQERTIQSLQRQMDRALRLIQDLTGDNSGELYFFFISSSLNFFTSWTIVDGTPGDNKSPG